MEPIRAPKTIKVYTLIRQNGLSFSTAANIASTNMGSGFFPTLQEAEHYRTLEVLKVDNGSQQKLHIYELEVPNPAYEGKE